MKDYHSQIHEVKYWPVYYTDIRNGAKQFELRKNDRDYRVGDLLILREYNPHNQSYTGYATCAVVTSIVDDETFLQPGFVAMGIRVLS